ncbi:MAG: hypothetical protein ACI87N_003566 [Flavobacteriales bacterium]|jgi:hypothetical protein
MFEFIFACFITSAILFAPSCKKDIEGCTDASSLNFNPDADADPEDESCIYLRDKVIGDWDAVKFSLMMTMQSLLDILTQLHLKLKLTEILNGAEFLIVEALFLEAVIGR